MNHNFKFRGLFQIGGSIICLLIFFGCNNSNEGENNAGFTLMKSDRTGIDFTNKLTESDSVNFLVNQYVYIGSGVGLADFNKDGLQDIFFAGEQVSCRLYINKGNFTFDDRTKEAGVATKNWCTGVSIVDINSDGLPDIYVSVSHAANAENRKNLLFINESDTSHGKTSIRFSEQAAAYGLDDAGFSTQAAFFDCDQDGDLDMYLMNHNVFQNQPNNIVYTEARGTSVAADRLYRNEGVSGDGKHPHFIDISAEAGIKDDGYGLGLVVSDLNNDGWPDVYVANDFLSNDILWLNNKNGTFTNIISRSMRHQSYNSMGADAADINNDQLPDIAVLDMQPETNYRKKTMFAGTNAIKYEMEQKSGGYQPQFTRNMLQLNHGNRQSLEQQIPFFSEIGQLSGVSETDWSWSVLLADFDNDGWKDMQITNGIAKDLTNNDFLFFRSGQNRSEGTVDNPIAGYNNDRNNITQLRKELDSYGTIAISNYLFHNNGNLSFSNITESSGMNVPSVSHGAAYGDLDNDGDLDLVINNMNQAAFVWRNETRKSASDSLNNFLSIELKGKEKNPDGVGAKLLLYVKDSTQYLEQQPVRGYLSSIDARLHFGVGHATEIDSIKIMWTDGVEKVLKNIKSNQFLKIDYDSSSFKLKPDSIFANTLFEDAANLYGIFFRHDEISFFDFGNQRLLPQKYSQLGPCLAVADVNGDSLQDFFVGGGSYQSGKIFIQQRDGNFLPTDIATKDKAGEDIASLFFDADGDHDLDLLITQGSSEFGNSRTLNVPRLYLNDGKGNFQLNENAIPREVFCISQALTTGDYDGDGDEDIFIGGRVLADLYPESPRSYILRNDRGVFTDVTIEVCPLLEKPGMITAALWVDYNEDGKKDLVICGDWMPVRFFKNNGGKLVEDTDKSGVGYLRGMWRSLKAVDLDGDGDLDFVAGNIGNNNKYHVSSERPMKLFAKDIDGNESIDLLPAYYMLNGKNKYDLFPAIDRTDFAQELPSIKKRYLLNRDFANVTAQDILSEIDKACLIELRCDTMASLWIENTGKGKFQIRSLPIEAQFAPVNSILADDLDNDGIVDLLLAGNEYQVEIGTGRYDASYGLFLKGNKAINFQPLPPVRSGIIIDGDVKSLSLVKDAAQRKLVLTGVNYDWLRCFRLR